MAGVCEHLGIPTPKWAIAHSRDELEEFAPRLGFPVLVRPSYVLGGRGMKIVRDLAELRSYLGDLAPHLREHPVLIDRFLEDAVEVDVDGISDGRDTFTVVMEQIERAGIHSGDSACVYPPQTLAAQTVEQIRGYTHTLAQHLGVVGLINVQYAVKAGEVYLLEVNARASRTVPFASKASGVPLARLATRLILGDSLSDLEINPGKHEQVSVKAVVLPFDKFPSLDRTLGPEMQSTGERMGIAPTYAEALAKAGYLPTG
jgi:carbamoyl-phosphate synthase large subunit